MIPEDRDSFFGKVAAAVTRRAWFVLILGALLAGGAIFAAAGMPVKPVTESFFDGESDAYLNTQRAEETFGQDPVVILARGDLADTLRAENIQRLNVLELCVAGDIKRGRGTLFRICKELAEMDAVQVAVGPATFLTRAVDGIVEVYNQQAALLESLPEGSERAEELAQQQLQLAAEIVTRYGLTKLPSIDDQNFVNRVVFGAGNSQEGQPKAKLAYLFPNRESAQVVLRLRSDLTEREQSRAIELIKAAAADQSTQLQGVEYTVTGSPVVFEDLSSALQTGIVILALVALLLMSLALGLVFGSRWRLAPLALALGGVAVSFGILRLAGGSISLAALGAVPILIGLTVDYAVQIQARHDETDGRLGAVDAARQAAALGLPMIVTACLASAAGFAALLISTVPLIFEFGLLLAAGVLICLAFVFVYGFALLALRGRGDGQSAPLERAAPFGAVRDGAKSVLALAMAAPSRLLLVSLLIAACGWAVGTQAKTAGDISQLLPTRSGVVSDLLELEQTTGASGEVGLIVRAKDVTAPAVVTWMDSVRREVLSESGYAGENPSCADAELCPGPAITDFIVDGGKDQSAKEIRQTLRNLPRTELEAMIAGGLAGKKLPVETKIPFILRSGSVEGQREVIDRIQSAVDRSRDGAGPPPGVTVELAGLPVVVAATTDQLADSRYLLIAAAILAVGLVLLLVYRSWKRVLVPLIPIVVAGGWSALIVAALDLSLNPLSAVLAVLVTAIATEFSVILSGRYFQERRGGLGMADALRATYGRTGMAIAASGATAIAGFAALAASDIHMLRDFGLVAVVDLTVALLGVAIVLPAVLAWQERR